MRALLSPRIKGDGHSPHRHPEMSANGPTRDTSASISHCISVEEGHYQVFLHSNLRSTERKLIIKLFFLALARCLKAIRPDMRRSPKTAFSSLPPSKLIERLRLQRMLWIPVASRASPSARSTTLPHPMELVVRHSKLGRSASAVGHQQTLRLYFRMSALPQKADII
jgi:hypothetical protein